MSAKFWMVSIHDLDTPVVKYKESEKAYDEAKCLAKKTGEKTYVLEVIAMFETPEPVLSMMSAPAKSPSGRPLKFSPRTGVQLADERYASEYRFDDPRASEWYYNPWTGQARIPATVTNDPLGFYIKP